MPRDHVLVVDDDANLADLLARHLDRSGFEVSRARDGQQCLDLLDRRDIDLVVSDVRMPGMDGMELLAIIRERPNTVPVIVMTAFGTIDQAVEAIRDGAIDYVSKPFPLDEIVARVRRVLKHKRPRADDPADWQYERMVGRSPVMQRVFEKIRLAAGTRSTVLIGGSSGTGKEMVAEAIHRRSPDPTSPFVVVDCSAIPEPLIESELFGYVRGAFTGADRDRPGLFEQAHGGTLFLDEIGCLNLAAQAKLLRAIERYSVRRLGSNRRIEIDVRYIAATNIDLADEAKAGRFREDLYFRLNVLTITLPPLRERPEDIPLLIDVMLERARSQRPDSPVIGVDEDALAALAAYDWPGNVRELANAIERSVVLCNEPLIGKSVLPPEIRAAGSRLVGTSKAATTVRPLSELVDAHIDRVLEIAGGNRSAAARMLGIDRRTLQRHLQRRSGETT